VGLLGCGSRGCLGGLEVYFFVLERHVFIIPGIICKNGIMGVGTCLDRNRRNYRLVSRRNKES
jgi:hypothetical protein